MTDIQLLPTIMKNLVLILYFLTILSGCKESSKNELDSNREIKEKISLEYVDEWNQIELTQTDDKYGEWGGDSDIITIYSDGKTLYANYSRFLGSLAPPPPPAENEESKKWFEYKELDFKIDSIKLDKEKIKLVENAIVGLIKQKIQNQSYISHSGIYNSVITRDSSLIIDDFPSGKWITFQELKESIINK
ncbi:hypothetical protein BUL40_13615 [Croceivirga radicis]|uniref:Uncharacterized protein n=2 Tax=Croceivirga radicis TaxID=1929488 RepID=A0A1V6LPI4_9FLAO|nr:hypothetical protein BUL40_13615 [Croceivirga radicis]